MNKWTTGGLLLIATGVALLLGVNSRTGVPHPSAHIMHLSAQELPHELEKLTLYRFPATANTEHSYSCISLNERRDVAVFSSSRSGGYGGGDIWISRRENGRWSDPESAGEGVNTEQHEYDPSVSPDGSRMFFTRSAIGGATAIARLGQVSDKRTDLYVSYYRNQQWSRAEMIPAPVNLPEAAEYRAVLSQDEKRLYFGSDRAGGYGGFDLYVSQLVDGRWGQPKNLGPLVNTAGKEVDAAVAPHENTLILALQRENDAHQKLYISRYVNGAWSRPVEMGPRFNTLAGDGCPWLGYDGHTLYVNSRWDQILTAQPAARASIWTFEYSKGF